MTALQSKVIGTEPARWQDFKFIQTDTFKELSPSAEQKLKTSILTNDFSQPFYVWQKAPGEIYCLDGFHRVRALKQLATEGYSIPEELPATFIDLKDEKEAAKYVLVYSSMYAKITEEGLFDFLQLNSLDFQELSTFVDIPDFDTVEFNALLHPDTESKEVVAKSLQAQFLVPPFSILDTRQGYWQERKKQWHALGINSQETREDVELVAKSGQSPAIYELRNKMRDSLGREPDWDEIIEYAKKKGMHIYEGASIFDPVLTEICYRWFVPPGGTILDPFAGGSVRGIVAGVLGLNYHGIDLRKEQVAANNRQWNGMKKDIKNRGGVTWYAGDSREEMMQSTDGKEPKYDFVFSCPPYHDLEKYSDDPADLSNMDYEQFCEVYSDIIFGALMRLKPNRFACFVVGDIRDNNGFYRDFVGETVRAFTNARLCDGHKVGLYNEIILVNVAGSLPVRIGRQFEGYRKVGKMHQNVLVFYKGNPKKIKEEFPQIKVDELLDSTEQDPNIAL